MSLTRKFFSTSGNLLSEATRKKPPSRGLNTVKVALVALLVPVLSSACIEQEVPLTGSVTQALSDPTDPPSNHDMSYAWVCEGDLNGLDLTSERDNCQKQGWQCKATGLNKYGNHVCTFECEVLRCCVRICDQFPGGSCTSVCSNSNGQCRTTYHVLSLILD